MNDYKSYLKKNNFNPKYSDSITLNDEEGETYENIFGVGNFDDFELILEYVSDENGWTLETQILYRVTKNSYIQIIRFFDEFLKLNPDIHPEQFRIESQYKIDPDLTVCENVIEALKKRFNTRRKIEGYVKNFGSNQLEKEILEKILKDGLTFPPYWYLNFKESWDFCFYEFKLLHPEKYSGINFQINFINCDIETFYQPIENTIPLFLEYKNDLHPKMSKEQISKLKNQKIALLKINSDQEEEIVLDIYESKENGLFLKTKFQNKKRKSLRKRIELFNKMNDFEKVRLFQKMVNGEPTLYDDLLKQWWEERY